MPTPARSALQRRPGPRPHPSRVRPSSPKGFFNMDDLRLVDYKPKPKLVHTETRVLTPRFPAIDAHNHLGVQFGGGWDQRPLPELLDVLDQTRVRMLVDLDGGWGEDLLNAHLEKFKQAAPERFQIFGGVDWSRWPDEGNRRRRPCRSVSRDLPRSVDRFGAIAG